MAVTETYNDGQNGGPENNLGAIESGSEYSNEARRLADVMGLGVEQFESPEVAQTMAEINTLLDGAIEPEDAAMFTVIYANMLQEMQEGNEHKIANAARLEATARAAHEMRLGGFNNDQKEAFSNAVDYVVERGIAGSDNPERIAEVLAQTGPPKLRVVGEGETHMPVSDVPVEARLQLQNAGIYPMTAFAIERSMAHLARDYADGRSGRQTNAARAQIDALLDVVHSGTPGHALAREELDALVFAANSCFNSQEGARENFHSKVPPEVDPATYVVYGPATAISGQPSRLEQAYPLYEQEPMGDEVIEAEPVDDDRAATSEVAADTDSGNEAPEVVILQFDDEEHAQTVVLDDGEAAPGPDDHETGAEAVNPIAAEIEAHQMYYAFSTDLRALEQAAQRNDIESMRDALDRISDSASVATMDFELGLDDESRRHFNQYINDAVFGALTPEQIAELGIQPRSLDARFDTDHPSVFEIHGGNGEDSGIDDADPQPLVPVGEALDGDDEPEMTPEEYRAALEVDAAAYGISPELLEVLDEHDLEPVVAELSNDMETALWGDDFEAFDRNAAVMDELIGAYVDKGIMTVDQANELRRYIGNSFAEARENQYMRAEAQDVMVRAREHMAQVEATYRRRGSHGDAIDTFAEQYRAAMQDADSRGRDLHIDPSTGAVIVVDRATGQPVQENVRLPFVNAEVKQIAAARVHYEMALEEYSDLQTIAIGSRMTGETDPDAVGAAIRNAQNNLVAREHLELSLAETEYFAENRSQQIASAISRMSKRRTTILAGAVGVAIGGVPGLVIAGGAAARTAYRGSRGADAQREAVYASESNAENLRAENDAFRAQIEAMEDRGDRFAALARSLDARSGQFSSPEALRGTIGAFNRVRSRARVGERFNNSAVGEWMHRDARPRALEDMVLRAARLEQRGSDAGNREAQRIMAQARDLSDRFGIPLPDTRTLRDANRRAMFGEGGSLNWRARNRRIEAVRQRDEAVRRMRDELGLNDNEPVSV